MISLFFSDLGLLQERAKKKSILVAVKLKPQQKIMCKVLTAVSKVFYKIIYRQSVMFMVRANAAKAKCKATSNRAFGF